MYVYLFGSFHVSTRKLSEVELRPTAARLLAFLLLHRDDAHHREMVAESFWHKAEIGRARKSLNTTLWQLRNALGRADEIQGELITTTLEQIRINQQHDLWLDVALFEEQANRGLAHPADRLSPPAIRALEESTQLYRGDLLTGFFDSWALSERERLRLIYLRCLTHLMEHHQHQNNLDISIDYAQRILSVEPWREDVHRRLMRLYAESGRRTSAIEQYKLCRQILAEELDIPPLAETKALYQQLVAGSPAGHLRPNHITVDQPPAENGSPDPTLRAATQQLQTAVQMMKDAQAALNHAVALVEHLTQRDFPENR